MLGKLSVHAAGAPAFALVQTEFVRGEGAELGRANAGWSTDLAAEEFRSLTPNEVYALVAFLYYRNGIIKEADVMDEKSLPKVEMPNKNGFVPAKPVYPIDPKQPSWY